MSKIMGMKMFLETKPCTRRAMRSYIPVVTTEHVEIGEGGGPDIQGVLETLRETTGSSHIERKTQRGGTGKFPDAISVIPSSTGQEIAQMHTRTNSRERKTTIPLGTQMR